MKSLRIHPGVSVIATRAGVLLRSDLATYQVSGADARAFVERLIPLLDGTRDRAAIVAALGDRSAASVGAVLDQLGARGILEEGGDGETAEEGFFRAWAGDAREMRQRLAEARVLVVGRAGWGRAVAREIAAAGVKVNQADGVEQAISDDAPIRLLVAAVAAQDAAAIDRLSRDAHRAKVTSLWAHEAGGSVVLGPLVVPGETACRVCAAVESIHPMMADGGREARVRGVSPALLGHLVAMEAIKIVSGYTPSRLGGRVLIEDLGTWTSSLHTLARLPWCRVCGVAR